MNLSYWEKKIWFDNVDFCIVGSGIVGVNCALELRRQHPKAKILILERGVLPQGASTKNAGFACFGSLSELLSDLKTHSEEDLFDLVQQRYEGLKLLRNTLGDRAIKYQQNAGFEVFLNHNQDLLETCKSQMEKINKWLKPIFKDKVFKIQKQTFGFKNCLSEIIVNPFEGQIDTGSMMKNLISKALKQDITIMNGLNVDSFSDNGNLVQIRISNFEFTAKQLFIATNGFANSLLKLKVKPARNQVLITKPVKALNIKGTFHLDEGYYYFRNIDQRILLGGGRHLDKIKETIDNFRLTQTIQKKLQELLSTVILPDQSFEIEHQWSGILGVGNQKKPILKKVSPLVFCAVRLGGMGVAIGSQMGKNLANILKS
ncbi:NAD(P)/FAD-dependent oxidoreductase [Mesohalobacter halotolerans]|uniref:FAD-binding oxidoreductase n=1 Tax=Mesohalobacter halotolerans TaxID=1883405 RepID=A0A4U5TNB5_9FLAO|nr:FAD-dependent oxidoreductase [Mesohalobacter halotolerans]TKS55419.1 FAD-binding oxidoreductase [Mesohalobacter halotolerans]